MTEPKSNLPTRMETGAIVDRDKLLSSVRGRTPARIFTGRAGFGYSSATQLELRADHAAAIDAVRAEIDLARDFDPRFVEERQLFEVQTQAGNKDEFLRRPDLGRRLSDDARERIAALATKGADLQIVLGDGLSVAAVAAQVPVLLPRLEELAQEHNWTLGQTFLVRHCRVGVMNDIGDALSPRVLVLLIGERPGLATAESLSAYMTFRPRAGQTDADRNLVSNIHARGVSCEAAAVRIIALAREFLRHHRSGWSVKEVLPTPAPTIPLPPP